MVILSETAQGTTEWHLAREGKFTGSNAYKLLGSGGASEYAKAIQQKFKGTYWTKRGHVLETEAIELYKAITGDTVARPGFVTNSLYPSSLFSPDGITDRVVIEVKCFDEKEHLRLIRGDIKLSVLAQIHFGMLICEKPLAHLIAYNPALDPEKYSPKDMFKIIPIKANKNIQANFKRILSNAM